MGFSLRISFQPPWRDIEGRFVAAEDKLDSRLRDELGRAGQELVKEIGREARGGEQGTIGRNVFYRTHGNGRAELRIYVGQIGKWHLSGTGIYGPRGSVIRPVKAQALHFFVDGEEVFAKWVRGVTPDNFVERGYRNWLPNAEAVLRRVALGYMTDLK